jgi:hypothetical protein
MRASRASGGTASVFKVLTRQSRSLLHLCTRSPLQSIDRYRFADNLSKCGHPAWGCEMRTLRSIFFVFVILGLCPMTAFGQIGFDPCRTTADCPDGQSCQTGFLGFKQCLFEYCNVDSDCSRRGSVCSLGICRLPASGGGGSSGHGQSGAGGVCGPQRLGGGVIKSIGCQQGLQCRNGRCERPAP